LTCSDLDHVLQKGDGDAGRCTLPSTGTVDLVANPTEEIWEQYKYDCNHAYYDYKDYNTCDDWLADNLSPIHIFESKYDEKVYKMNDVYK